MLSRASRGYVLFVFLCLTIAACDRDGNGHVQADDARIAGLIEPSRALEIVWGGPRPVNSGWTIFGPPRWRCLSAETDQARLRLTRDDGAVMVEWPWIQLFRGGSPAGCQLRSGGSLVDEFIYSGAVGFPRYIGLRRGTYTLVVDERKGNETQSVSGRYQFQIVDNLRETFSSDITNWQFDGGNWRIREGALNVRGDTAGQPWVARYVGDTSPGEPGVQPFLENIARAYNVRLSPNCNDSRCAAGIVIRDSYSPTLPVSSGLMEVLVDGGYRLQVRIGRPNEMTSIVNNLDISQYISGEPYISVTIFYSIVDGSPPSGALKILVNDRLAVCVSRNYHVDELWPGISMTGLVFYSNDQNESADFNELRIWPSRYIPQHNWCNLPLVPGPVE
jgi:hypothetical protein